MLHVYLALLVWPKHENEEEEDETNITITIIAKQQQSNGIEQQQQQQKTHTLWQNHFGCYLHEVSNLCVQWCEGHEVDNGEICWYV